MFEESDIFSRTVANRDLLGRRLFAPVSKHSDAFVYMYSICIHPDQPIMYQETFCTLEKLQMRFDSLRLL